MLSVRKDIVLGLYTCSHPEQIEKYIAFFKENGIYFKHTNKNPDAKDTKYGNFQDKPYMNVLWDDKAGFDPENDWKLLRKLLKKYPKDYLKKN